VRGRRGARTRQASRCVGFVWHAGGITNDLWSDPDYNPHYDPDYDDFFFDDYDDEEYELRPRPRWIRWLATAVVVAVLVTGVSAGIGALGTARQIHSEQVEIEAQAWVDESPWGWLVTRLIVQTIDQPEVGAYVIEGRRNGVIYLDQRSWERADLEQTMAHEVGHLIEFSAYRDVPEQARRGGLESEVWAECAAVFQDERKLDGDGAKQRYRCTPGEYNRFVTEMESITEICRTYRDTLCVPLADGRPIFAN